MHSQSRRRQPVSIPASLLSLLLVPYLFSGSLSFVAAQKAFNCNIVVGSSYYDLTDLAGEHSASRDRDSPPTRIQDQVRFNLCADLDTESGVPEADQCSSGTRACLVKTNMKSGELNRVFAVIPLTQSSSDPVAVPLAPGSNGRPTGFNLTFSGPAYPSSGPLSAPQGFTTTLLCASSAENPVFKAYEGGIVTVEWSTPAACAGGEGGGGGGEGGDKDTETPPPSPTEPEAGSAGGSLGVFFLLLVVAFLGYFALGAYYNYTTYGATGADLIPHRDFWREVPYMARDVLSHLCGNIRQSRAQSRTGYISV